MKELENQLDSGQLEFRKTRRLVVKAGLMLGFYLMLEKYLSWYQPGYDNREYKKFLIYTDTHIGKHDSSPRQANAQAANTLNLLTRWYNFCNFDGVLHLGDHIVDSLDETESVNNLNDALNPFVGLIAEVIALRGNHVNWNLPPQKVDRVYQNLGLSNQPIIVKQYPGFQLIMLNSDTDGRGMPSYLNPELVYRLRHHIYKDIPTVIGCHLGVTSQDLSYNFYYRNCPELAILSNSKEIKHELKGLPVTWLAGHTHDELKVNETDGLVGINFPASVERLVPGGDNPGVVSTILTNGVHSIINSYSGTRHLYHREINSPRA